MNDYQWLGLAVLPFLVALVMVLVWRARNRPPGWDEMDRPFLDSEA